MSLLSGITQKPLQLRLCALFVASATPQIALPGITFQVYRFGGAIHFGDMKSEYMLALYFVAMGLHGNHAVQFLSAAQRGKEVVLNLVGFFHAGYDQLTVDFADAEDQPATRCVGEGGYGFVGIFRDAALGALALKVVPFNAFQSGLGPEG